PREKPGKPPVSVRVENTSNYRPVSQNTAGLHLICRPVKPLASSFFVPRILSHLVLQTLPEHHYEALFFPTTVQFLKSEQLLQG
ncbi:MAG TPA: hypothetical protein VN227_03585, partial [Methanoregula sp.]|nr:hypothetical protein [Methanoregula sp.]